MNITVRVMTKQAQMMLANLERQLTTTSRVASTASFGGAQATRAAVGFKRLGNSMQWAGYQLMHAFTIPLALAGGAAVKYELDNERAFAGVQKVYGDTALAAQHHGRTVRNELVALRKEFIALSDVYGVSQTDVIKVAEAWAAAGVSGAALGKSVENTLKTMVIGDLDSAAATKALIAIQAQYGASTKEMTKILQALNVTENITGATMGDLIEGFSRSASVAAQAGVDYKHLAAMIGALVPAQGTASRAGNALKTIITRLLVPTADAAQALKEMGINIEDASWRSLTATERLEVLSQKFKKLDGNQKVAAANYIAGKYQISRFDQSMVDLGKSFDAQGRYLGDNSKALGYYGKTLAATRSNADSARVAQNELNTVLQSNPQKLKQVWTILKNEAGAAVTGLIPFLIQFVTIIAGLVKWFGNLNPVIQRWVAILLISLALLGPILLYIAAMSKLMHVLGTVFRTVGKGVMWFFGLFNSEKRTIARLNAQIAELRAELESLTGTTAVEKLNAEFEALTVQVAALKGEAVSTSETMSAASTAATETIIANDKAAAISDFERNAQLREDAKIVRMMQERYAAEWVAEWQAANARNAEVYALTSAEIVQEAGVAAAALEAQTAARLVAETTAAANFAAIWTAAYGEIVAAAKAAATVQTMITLAAMRAMMGELFITTRTWEAQGLLQAASVDAVNAQLVMQLRLLQAIQAQALLTSRTMISANATTAASSAALVPMAGGARAAATTERYGAAAVAGEAGAMRAANGKLYAETRTATAKTEGIFARSVGKIGGFFKSGFSKIGRLLNMVFMGVPGMIGRLLLIPFAAAAAAIGVPVGVIIAIVAALVAIFLVFRHQITDAFVALARGVAQLGKWIWSGLKSIGGFFVDLARTIWEALAALPRAVVAIFKAVVNIIAEAAHQIYEFFQYINPFAHHSPSLVENVDRGMDLVAKKFAGVRGSISASMRGAYGDIQRFGSAIAGLVKGDRDLQEAADIQLLSKQAPNAVAAYRALAGDLHRLTAQYDKLGISMAQQQQIVEAQQGVVDRLNRKLEDESYSLQRLQAVQSAANDALEKSKQKLQDFADAPIKGMKAMEDQIFANDIAQKRLQLQMLKMEDTIGPIDKVQAKMTALAGQIEKLKGEQGALRAGGAGSDILDSYNKEIAKLEGQQGTIQKSVDNYQKLQDALDELQHKGQELSLEQSLKFDPLTKKIQDLTNAAKELPFDKIVAGLKSAQAEIDKNTSAYDKATTAVDKQQAVVDRLTSARDKQQRILDLEQRKLDSIQKVYQKVGDTIADVTDSMHLMTDAANDMAQALEKAKGAGSGGDKLLAGAGHLPTAGGKNVLGRIGGLGDQSDQIEKDAQRQMDKLKGLFGKMDLFGGIKDFFGGIGRWIKKWIWEEPAKWGDWITARVKTLAPLVWSWIWKGIKNIGHWISNGWNSVVRFFTSLPGKILRFVKSLPHLLVTAGKKLIYGLGYGIGFALGMIARLMLAVPTLIVKAFIGAGKWLYHHGWNLIKGLGKGIGKGLYEIGYFFVHLPIWIGKFFARAIMWLGVAGKDVLVGLYHGVIAGAKGIWSFLKSLPGRFVSFFTSAPGWLADVGLDIIKGLWNGITGAWDWLWDKVDSFVSGLINGFKDALGISSPSTIFAEIGKDILKGLWNGIVFIATKVYDWFIAFPGKILKKIGDATIWLVQKGKDILKGVLTGIGKKVVDIINWFGDLPGNVIKWIGDATGWLIQKGKDILRGVLTGLGEKVIDIINWFENLPSKILSVFTKAGNWLVKAGKSIGQGLIDGVTTALEFLSKVFGTPIYWAVKYAINPIITGLNYIPGVDISHIDADSIPHFRRGGKVPGSHSRDDVPIYATPGELVVPTYITKMFGGAERLMEMLGFNGRKGGPGSHFAGGGVPVGGTPGKGGGVTDSASNNVARAALAAMGGFSVFGGFADWIGHQIDRVTDLLREGAGKIFEATVANPIKSYDNHLDTFGEPGRIFNHAIDSSLDTVVDWIYGREDDDQKKLRDLLFSGTVGNHRMLIDQALQYAHQNIDAQNEYIVDTIVKFESGWNPNAINLTDSNAKAGHPSQGLMQTIPSTFAAYRLPSLPNDITNPISNLVAGIRYAVARYGSLSHVPGIVALMQGGRYVGYDNGGLLPTGVSQVVNNTGLPEVIAPQKTFDQIFNRVADKLALVDRAWHKLDAADGRVQNVTNNVTNNNTTNITLTGDLSFPNVESGSDATDFISNLESLVKR